MLFVKYSYTKNLIQADIIKNNYIGIPIEINSLIAQYIPTKYSIELIFEIKYPTRHPYISPKWKLCNIIHNNFPTLVNLDDYYNYIVSEHNKYNKLGWSITISIEKDVLRFISRINYFEYLLDLVK